MLQRTPRPLAAALLLLPLVLGCVGSPNPYRPGYEPRPAEIPPPDAVEQAKRDAIPIEISRTDARLRAARKEAARILGEVPVNPWNSYRADMELTLGAEAGSYMTTAVGAAAPASTASEAGDEGEDMEAGGDDEDWGSDDESDDEDW